ncbi:MAG: bifunctional diaminohydroxyphosphoribosylaminopyrimidine deaminase/5-amino-6-(5-phosphoribosylamino)uracil reductase RibD [Bacteroidales bacterium]
MKREYMLRALELAEKGRGRVSPNPMVGAVIVHDDCIIGEGYHRVFGEAHAEVNAVNSVRNKELLSKSTLYVTLEPCSHWGKTPPCAELIIRMGIPKVIIACVDPFPKVAGRGIAMMREAGIEIEIGLCEEEARQQNKVFFTAFEKCRPYITLKWAQSADGFLDKKREPDAPHVPTIISTPYTHMLVHKLRSEVDGIMVGTNTVIQDNPSLTVRRWSGHNPTRITVDRTHRIPSEYHLLDGSTPTLLFTSTVQEGIKAEQIEIDFDKDPLLQILWKLHSRKIYHLLVEGGSQLHESFIQAGLWDELIVETSATALHEGVKAPAVAGVQIHCERHGSASVATYRNDHLAPEIFEEDHRCELCC